MTETTSGHLDLDALADALAGEGDAAATAHLSGCPSCTSRLHELEAAEQRVVAVLSTLPPPDLPAGLAERLSAALAAEAPLAAATTGASVTALPDREARRRRTWLPAAAAAVLLASGAGLGWALLGGSGSDTSDEAGDDLRVSATGADYADPGSLAGVLPGVLAGGAEAAAGTTFTSEGRSSAAAAGSAEASQDAATTAQAPEAAGDPLERLRTPDGLAACLNGLADGEQVEPLALDYATYAGAPALAVLLPDPDPAKVAVFVVGPACAQADPALLHYVRVDRPEE